MAIGRWVHMVRFFFLGCWLVGVTVLVIYCRYCRWLRLRGNVSWGDLTAAVCFDAFGICLLAGLLLAILTLCREGGRSRSVVSQQVEGVGHGRSWGGRGISGQGGNSSNTGGKNKLGVVSGISILASSSTVMIKIQLYESIFGNYRIFQTISCSNQKMHNLKKKKKSLQSISHTSAL